MTSGIGSFASTKKRVVVIMLGEHRRGLSHLGRLVLVVATAAFLPLLPVLGKHDNRPFESPDFNSSSTPRAAVQATTRANELDPGRVDAINTPNRFVSLSRRMERGWLRLAATERFDFGKPKKAGP